MYYESNIMRETYFFEERARSMSTMDVLAAGVSYTPEDRMLLILRSKYSENMLLGHHKEEQFRRRNLFVD